MAEDKSFQVNKNCCVFMPKDTFESYNDITCNEGSLVVIYPTRLAGKDLPESLKEMAEILKIQDKRTGNPSKFRFWQK